jgi:hypothetical protein
MVDAKSVADLITVLRGFMAFFLVWLGFEWGKRGLSTASYSMILCWIGDFIDGKIARMNNLSRHSWVGDHDIHIDMFVSMGLGVFMVGAGYVTKWVAICYVITWMILFWRIGLDRNLMMVFQAPIYTYFIWISLHEAQKAGCWIIIVIFIILTVNWRRFSEEIIPEFMRVIKHI